MALDSLKLRGLAGLTFVVAVTVTAADEPVAPSPISLLKEAKAHYTHAEATLSAELESIRTNQPSLLEALGNIDWWPHYRVHMALAIAAGGVAEMEHFDHEHSPEYWAAAASIANEHARMLRALQANPPRDKPWQGLWLDGRGGEMRIVQQGGTLFFTLWVTRGPTHHTGGIAGQTTVNQQLAHYSDRDKKVDKPEGFGETWLNFKLHGPTIQVDGANTGFYHGARAYFDGRYVRVESLSENEAAEVVAGHVP